MNRTTLLALALPAALALPGAAGAQLTMQMDNGWAFTLSGNVNAFYVYHHGSVDQAIIDAGGERDVLHGLVDPDRVSRIRTGLLPGFAVLNAKGREGNVDLGVQIGFAPQINSNSLHDNFGAQIDMRQVFLTVGGTWGQILAGRELGLYQRQNILTDMTLFATGASGAVLGAGGTTLGRIGFGYLYPNFNAQMTYSTAAGKPFSLAVGLFDPSVVVGEDAENFGDWFFGTQLPRVEAEFTYTADLGGGQTGNATKQQAAVPAGRNKVMLFASGLVQNTQEFTTDEFVDDNKTLTSLGVAGGAKLDVGGISLVGSGYFAQGLGTTLMFGQGGGAVTTNAQSEVDGRGSLGYIGQATFTPRGGKTTFGLAYGASSLDEGDDAAGSDLVESNSSIDALVSYQWTKSLRYVVNYTYAKAESFSGLENTSNQASTGLMLFF